MVRNGHPEQTKSKRNRRMIGIFRLIFGLDQINVRLKRNLIGRGDVDVSLTVEGMATNAVQINVR